MFWLVRRRPASPVLPESLGAKVFLGSLAAKASKVFKDSKESRALRVPASSSHHRIPSKPPSSQPIAR